MLKNLKGDIQLRGAIFEEVGRRLTRRKHTDAFIFHCKHFASIAEIVIQYRLDTSNISETYKKLRDERMRTDIVEFRLENFENRIVKEINFYEIKTKAKESKQRSLDMCQSNHEFMYFVDSLASCNAPLISIMLFEDWRFSFNINKYKETYLRIFNSSSKRTVGFQKPGKIEKRP